ncbi:MAG: hypothetical protein HKN35_15795 [Woeseia sp.]|nr:hypothetical protein [Woeseia sp.]
MAKPIREKILDEILARCANISTKNAFEFTVNTVKEAGRDKDTHAPQPLDIIVDELEVNENEDLSYPGNPPRVAFDVEYAINGYARQLDSSDTESNVSDGVTPTQMGSAIMQTITTGGGWYTFGGNAVIASLSGSAPLQAPGHEGVTFTLLVTYRHGENDPYTAG